VDLLVKKEHLTQAEADVLAKRVPKVIVEPKEKETNMLSESVLEVFAKPKGKKATELKFSGRIQSQWDGIKSDEVGEDRNHFYFRRIYLGSHAKLGENWGGDVVLDFAASPNSEGSGKADQVFIHGASAWYKVSDAVRIDVGQLKVPFGMEETTSSAKTKAIERSAVNRQFADNLKFHARHMGLFAKGTLGETGLSYGAAIVNSGQNHNSKDSSLKDGLYGYEANEFAYFGHLAYTNDASPISYTLGMAAGVQQNSPYEDKDGNTLTVDHAYKALSEKTTAYNLFGNVGYGAFNLDAEYMFGEADATGGEHEHDGYAVQASYAISNALKGTWELVYRYSEVEGTGDPDLVSAKEIIRRANISDDYLSVDELEQHYIGLNYLFKGHDAKLMLGYEMNEAQDATLGDRDFDGPRARLQILF
ncbi:MAG: porin, partial [Opitutales bacterium]